MNTRIRLSIGILVAVAALSGFIGCSSEPVIDVGDTSIAIDDVIEHYKYQDRKPEIYTLSDAESYLESYAVKTLLEIAAREAGYYEDPMVVNSYESIRRRLLIGAYQADLFSDITVTEEELETWVEKNQGTGLWAGFIQCASLEEAQAAYERLEAGEDFGEVARDAYYLKGVSDIYLAQRGGLVDIPVDWRPVPRNETLYALEDGEYSEPFFYDLYNEWVYYIVHRVGEADPEEIPEQDSERLKQLLASEVLALRRNELLEAHLEELRGDAKIDVNQDLLDELDRQLAAFYEMAVAEELISPREDLLSLEGEDLAGIANIPGGPDSRGKQIAQTAQKRRQMLDQTLSAFFDKHKNDPLVTVNGESVALRHCSQHLLLWMAADDTRMLRPASRAEILQRFVDKSVDDELLLQQAVAEGFEDQPRMAARLQRRLNEAAVTQFFNQEFMENRPRPTEEEVQQFYQDNVDRFVMDERLSYQLFLTKDRELAEEVNAVVTDPDNYSADVEPVTSVAEIEERLASGEPMHRIIPNLLRVYIAELSEDVSTATSNAIIERPEADDFTRPGFEHETGWTSPVLEGTRDGETYYGILHVIDVSDPVNRSLENDPTLYDFIVAQILMGSQEEEFQAFLDELKQRYPVSVDLEQAADLLDSVMELSTQPMEE